MSNDAISTCVKANFNEPRVNLNKKQFKAQQIPNSHKAPFVVMRSTKPLTQTVDIELQTKKRSISRVKECFCCKEKRCGHDQHLTHFEIDNKSNLYCSKSGRNNLVANSPIKLSQISNNINAARNHCKRGANESFNFLKTQNKFYGDSIDSSLKINETLREDINESHDTDFNNSISISDMQYNESEIIDIEQMISNYICE